MKKYIIALDQGTTSSRAMVLCSSGDRLCPMGSPITASFLSSPMAVLQEVLHGRHVSERAKPADLPDAGRRCD